MMDFLDLDGKDEEEIVFDVFDLNNLQQDAFDELRDAKLTVQELASRVNRNRSTVQRALQDMLDKDLVMREGKTDKTVYYVYTALPMDEIRDITEDALDAWHEQIKEKLN